MKTINRYFCRRKWRDWLLPNKYYENKTHHILVDPDRVLFIELQKRSEEYL